MWKSILFWFFGRSLNSRDHFLMVFMPKGLFLSYQKLHENLLHNIYGMLALAYFYGLRFFKRLLKTFLHSSALARFFDRQQLAASKVSRCCSKRSSIHRCIHYFNKISKTGNRFLMHNLYRGISVAYRAARQDIYLAPIVHRLKTTSSALQNFVSHKLQ